mmetsp:Transcript_18934/g.30715  ORF Transcript_18934/g.30715 Transcript_18934/m.30715 type:complete len:933 (+) Transcript_18934:48-2846(+)|eukprot:CAMPEP_0169078098 /NCGR_PEP_ID=MMETSP1015-20121227/9234_1 /TAXON_ID=342587 /ORGANISM="Karlodinium micrum, Strain CCMP2283" /LENGTH=932 /DNA_ID=CAMNT_0009137673 /DNA_START=40 /DNA_END=2838 /DNA_ORIENTATION=-
MNYEWSQTDAEITVRFPLEGSVQKEKLKVNITAASLKVLCGDSCSFNTELSGKVVVDESFWSIESAGDTGRELVVSLCKKKSGKWKVLTKDEEGDLPEKSVLDDDFDVMNLEHDDDDPERVEEQEQNEKKLEARYAKLKSEKGMNHEDTLQTFFALFDNCIQLYRLNKLSDYLEDIVPVCRKRTDKYKLKAIQALAFVRWKQSKFREALPLLLEMEEILGKGAALCENIAHTYNSLGDYEKAEEYFRQALKFIEQENGTNKGNRGGVLLGLGLVRDRLGKQKEALPVCMQAYNFYKERANGAPASLQAKAGISCAKINAKLGNLSKAEAYIKEAVQMYEVTCGENSPLTASAYHELGKCYWAQRKRPEAQQALKRAYELEAMKDAWDLVVLLEIHNLLMDTHLKETTQIDRARFADYFKTAEYLVHRVKRELPQDGNAAVYYKAAAEMKAWGGKYQEAKALFEMAIPLLKAEKTTDCSGLVQSCNDMLGFCNRNLEGTQHSPMDFEVPTSAAQNGSSSSAVEQKEEDTGVKIEELPDDEDMENSEDAQFQDIEYEEGCRDTAPSDFAAAVEIAKASGRSPLFPDQASFTAYVKGPGAGLCLSFVRGCGDQEEVRAMVLCSSDGIFGHISEILCRADSLTNRGILVESCLGKCRERGLRSLHALVPAESDDGFYAGLSGWSTSQKVYSYCINEGRHAATASASQSASGSSSSSAPKDPSKLRRDGQNTSEFYDGWNKLNVEKALVEEDGLDPNIVPVNERPVEDFGVGALDVSSKLTTYSWDQSDKFVTIYVNYAGAGALPADATEVVWKQRGFCLIINEASGTRRWFKIPNLCKDIDTAASTKKVKADMVQLKLKKVAVGETWSDLNDDKDKYQKKREYRINHGDLKGATTEELLADMYQNATDEERAGLRDAMRVNREKREEDARNRAAGK